MPRKHRGADEDADAAEADRRRVAQPLASNVRRLRIDRALTQEALAERVGCASTYLQSVERGEGNVTARMLGALARALGVEVARLLDPVVGVGRLRLAGRPSAAKPTLRLAANRRRK